MSLSQYILTADEDQRVQARLRNKWMIRIRWYYLSVLLLVVLIANPLTVQDQSLATLALSIGVAAVISNGALWAATLPKRKSQKYYQSIAFLQTTIDLIIASFIIYSQGGLASRATILYAVPIVMSGVLYLGSWAYVTAFMCSIAYGLTLLMHTRVNDPGSGIHTFLLPAVFYPSVFFVLAAIISRFRVLNALQEREKSYSELLAMLRHQLRHPSGVIAAAIEMLESSNSKDKFTQKDRRHLKLIKEENHRLNSMISNLLESIQDQATSTPKTVSKINLTKLVDEVAQRCATAARRNNDLQINYPVEAIYVKAEPHQLDLAFENVIDNAFRYSESGSPVNIIISKYEPKIEIDIIDSGSGISRTQQKQLQRKFTKMDESEETSNQLYSMGLGLYVSKTVIERIGGKFEINRGTNGGTKVIIILDKGN